MVGAGGQKVRPTGPLSHSCMTVPSASANYACGPGSCKATDTTVKNQRFSQVIEGSGATEGAARDEGSNSCDHSTSSRAIWSPPPPPGLRGSFRDHSSTSRLGFRHSCKMAWCRGPGFASVALLYHPHGARDSRGLLAPRAYCVGCRNKLWGKVIPWILGYSMPRTAHTRWRRWRWQTPCHHLIVVGDSDARRKP